MKILYFIIAGLVGGVLGGLGMGGGTLLIPILTIFLNQNQHMSQAINLMSFIPMSVVALIIHAKNKLVNFKLALPIIFAGVVFSVLGSILANLTEPAALKLYFGIFLTVLGVFQALSLLLVKNGQNQRKSVNINKEYVDILPTPRKQVNIKKEDK